MADLIKQITLILQKRIKNRGWDAKGAPAQKRLNDVHRRGHVMQAKHDFSKSRWTAQTEAHTRESSATIIRMVLETMFKKNFLSISQKQMISLFLQVDFLMFTETFEKNFIMRFEACLHFAWVISY